MRLRISNLRVPVEAPEGALPAQIARKLGMSVDELGTWRILRKSLDARARDNLQFVYSVGVETVDAEWRPNPALRDVALYAPEAFDDPAPGAAPLEQRPVVVGSGPAGLAAAYYLALKGYQPLVVERGRPVKQRVRSVRAFDAGGAHDPEDNYLFGEGGAGCFSDGKLTCRMTGPDVDWVLQSFVDCGGRDSIRYEHRPHLGSNKLPLLCRNFRRKIEDLGGEYRFECRVEGLDVSDGRVCGLQTSAGYLAATHVVLAIGHSARDTYRMLHDSRLPMRAKAFQLGLRIEQPQAQVNHWKYGREEYLELLGAADYVLTARGQRDVYSFCMCAGGIVIPSISEPGMFCSNGMSRSRHDTPFANSGIMVTLQPEEFGADHPLAGVELQRRFEAAAFSLGGGDYYAPIQSAQEFLTETSPSPRSHYASSYARGVTPGDLRDVLPPEVLRAIRGGLPVMDRKWRGEFLKNATLVGPEMRGSSPVRIDRDPSSRQTPGFEGLYPVGEGAGYAGGIVSAAVDGLRSAREIVRHHARLSR